MQIEITKEMVESLSSVTITRKDYDGLLGLIDRRIDYIWKKILTMSKRNFEWWAFSNDVELGGNGSTGGEFDPSLYSEWIKLIGDCDHLDDDYYNYNNGFPTNFIWRDDEDWQAEVKENIIYYKSKLAAEKEYKKNAYAKRKEMSAKMKKIITGKLTTEELKYIKFK